MQSGITGASGVPQDSWSHREVEAGLAAVADTLAAQGLPVPALEGEGFSVRGYFFNPNIHPFSEHHTHLVASRGIKRCR